MRGKKTGGRVKGVLNKRTQEVVDRLDELGCDPIEGMAKIAMNAENSPDLRGRMYAELAQYKHPKRKAVELSGPGGSDTPFAVNVLIGTGASPKAG